MPVTAALAELVLPDQLQDDWPVSAHPTPPIAANLAENSGSMLDANAKRAGPMPPAHGRGLRSGHIYRAAEVK